MILPEVTAQTDGEGRFRLRTYPGPGFLSATRSLKDDAYGLGAEVLAGLPFRPSPRPTYGTLPAPVQPDEFNSIVHIDAPSSAREVAATIPIRATTDRVGTVVDSDGQPVRSGVLACGLEGLTTVGSDRNASLTSEHFTVHRVVAGRLRRVLFVHAATRRIGLVTTRDAEGPPLVASLQPWGAVRVRVEDPADDRRRGFVYARAARNEDDGLFPESQFPFEDGVYTAADRPQFEVMALVPDYPYDLAWGGRLDHPVIARNVRVRSGETLDLGTIRIEPPR